MTERHLNLFSLLVAQNDPKAVKQFLRASRRNKTKQAAWEELGISRATFYRLYKKLENEGHTL
jgi:ACT domain-containing protein